MAEELRELLIDLKQRAESLLLHALVALVRLWPLARASAIGGRLGRWIGPWLPVTGVARANLAAAFPEKSPGEIRAIARGMWDNLGRTIFEFAHLDHFTFLAEDANVVLRGREHIEALRDDGRGGILVSGHLANWELLGPTSAMVGLPLNLVYRAPNNPRVAWFYDQRRIGVAESIPKGAAGAKRVMAVLRNHRHVGFLVDQKMNDGIPVPFFGREAMTAAAPARFAFRFDVPLVIARIERIEGIRFQITVLPPLTFERTGDTAADVLEAMTRITAILEGWIRERPEQWFWLHRRWPRQPSTPER